MTSVSLFALVSATAAERPPVVVDRVIVYKHERKLVLLSGVQKVEEIHHA